MIELILACSAPRMTPDREACIRDAAQGVSCWDTLLATAARCRAIPALYERLTATAADVPEAIITQLRQGLLAATAYHAGAGDALKQALTTLQASGIPALVIKGPVLAAQVYDTPIIRRFDDLDILVRSQQLRAARDVLVAHGCTERLPLPAHVEQSPWRPALPYLLRDPHHIDIDLATRASHDYFTLNIPEHLLWEYTCQVAFEGSQITTLRPEIMLIILCAHGTKHLWRRPAWAADIAGLLEMPQTLAWDEIWRLAHRTGTRRMLCLGLALAQHLYGSSFPDDGLAADRSALTRTLRELTTYPGEVARDDLQRLRYHLDARERIRDRLRYLSVRALTPSFNDWRMVTLPRYLFPLYALVRPVRLLARAIRGAQRGPDTALPS